MYVSFCTEQVRSLIYYCLHALTVLGYIPAMTRLFFFVFHELLHCVVRGRYGLYEHRCLRTLRPDIKLRTIIDCNFDAWVPSLANFGELKNKSVK